MKKLFLCGAILLASLTALADYNFMEFNYSDGNVKVISAEGLTITVEGNTLEISNTKGESFNVDASSLTSMQFTNNDPAGVKTIIDGEIPVMVFDLEGRKIGVFESLNSARNALNNGIYVIKNSDGETIKLVIGK